jgi:hypothetical protein
MNYSDEIIDWIIDQDYNCLESQADIKNVLSFIEQKIESQSTIFFISDFKDQIFEEDFADMLNPIIEKFDFIPVIIMDPIEKIVSLKRSVNFVVIDNEGGGTSQFYLTPEKLKEFQEVSEEHLFNIVINFSQIGVDTIILYSSSIDDCYKVLSDYFKDRLRTRTRW